MKCNKCKKTSQGLSHKCNYCGKIHCPNHLLPENHECKGLKNYSKQKGWKSGLDHSFTQRHSKNHRETKTSRLPPKRKSYLVGKYSKFKYWLTNREYRRYNFSNKINYLLSTLAWFAGLIVVMAIVYANAQKINSFNLWIIKLTGVLLLFSLYFILKQGWRLLQEIPNIIKRQRNGIKYLIIIGFIFLLWQGYQERNTILDPIFEFNENVDYSLFNPLDISGLDLDSFNSNYDTQNFVDTSDSQSGGFFNSFIDPEREEECKASFEKLNNLRSEYGKNKLSWDDRAYMLAVDRSKDMYERNYFDHVTPEGTCAESMKLDYGFSNDEIIPENVGGMSYYSKGVVAGDCDEALEGWLDSRGHRYNLFYDLHESGAIGCYNEICVFFGVHNNFYGLGGGGMCYSASEGQAYWDGASSQPGEV